MKIDIINDVKVKDGKLHIDMDKKYEVLFINNLNHTIEVNLQNNEIDLLSIIKENKEVMRGENIYSICSKLGDVVKEMVVNQVSPLYEEYICKNLKLNIDDSVYIVDVYINSKNHIQIKIAEVVDLQAKVENMYIGNGKFNLEISLFKHCKEYTYDMNKQKSYDVKEGYVPKDVKFLVCNENDQVIEYKIKSQLNNIINIEIGLDQMILEEDCTFGAKLIIDSKTLEVKLDDTVEFKRVTLKKENLIKNVLIKSEHTSKNLVFVIDGSIDINPIILKHVYDNDRVSISGRLYSNMEFYKYDKHQVYLVLRSNDNYVTIENEIDINNDEFIYHIDKSELFQLRDVYSGIWNVAVQVRDDKDVLCEKELYSTVKESQTLFDQTMSDKNDAAIFEIYTTKNKQNVAFKICNKVNITQILSIRVKNNDLKVKFRTKENIENLLDNNNIYSDLKNDKEELYCKDIKKVGKKTYICKYTSKDSKKFIEESLDRGLSIITTIDEQQWVTNLSQINKYSIYYNFLDVVHSSKKYKKICTKLYEKVFLKLPVKKKRVLFESFLGRNVSGNPKYIYNYFVENKMDRKYQLIWILNDLDEEIPGRAKKVKRKSLKYYYYMATSGYWVFNVRQGDEIVKRPETTYLQTWHGTPLKRLASDMFNVDMGGVTDLDEYKESFFRNTRTWDYLLAQNDYSAEIFERAFNFKKEMVLGYPANDILYTKNNKEDIDKIKDKLGIPKDKKVLIYAPTWREDSFFKKGHYKMSIELDLDKMQKELSDEYIVIIRAHYLIASSINIGDYKGFVYDFSQGFDIQELYLVSDILITDYSSVMFDFANLKRPMIFFTYDLEKYRDSLRGFYFDFEKVAPGMIAMTTDQVVDTILNIDETNKEYEDKYEEFYNKFCHVDKGESAKTVFEKIFK